MPGLGWHFTDGLRYRDGRTLVVGEWVEHKGPLVMCEGGLHASVRAIDALRYAPGDTVSLVLCDGDIEHGVDKLICRRRRPLWTIDAKETLRLFARLCALDVLHLWNAPQVVRDYLETGAEKIRAAANAAASAWAAARAAARDAAWSAANAAARGSASGSDWDAARAAAGAAAAAQASSAWAGAAACAAARAAQNALLESLLIADAIDHDIDVGACS